MDAQNNFILSSSALDLADQLNAWAPIDLDLWASSL